MTIQGDMATIVFILSHHNGADAKMQNTENINTEGTTELPHAQECAITCMRKQNCLGRQAAPASPPAAFCSLVPLDNVKFQGN